MRSIDVYRSFRERQWEVVVRSEAGEVRCFLCGDKRLTDWWHQTRLAGETGGLLDVLAVALRPGQWWMIKAWLAKGGA